LREAGGFSKGLAVATVARFRKVFGVEPKDDPNKLLAAAINEVLRIPSI
jgi:hypothetical protein